MNVQILNKTLNLHTYINTGIQFAFDLKDGNYKKASFTLGSEVAFGALGKAVDNAADLGKITKTDQGILNFVSEGWSKLADFFYDKKAESK